MPEPRTIPYGRGLELRVGNTWTRGEKEEGEKSVDMIWFKEKKRL